MFTQQTNEKTTSACRGIPNPPNGEWLEVPDDDPRCAPGVDAKVEIQAQIDGMERAVLMPRITRESLLIMMVSTAASMGLTEPQLYVANIGYRKLKDFDTAIVALRLQKDAIV